MYFKFMFILAVLGIVIGALLSLIALSAVESRATKVGLIFGSGGVGGFFGLIAGGVAARGLEVRTAAEKQPLNKSVSEIHSPIEASNVPFLRNCP